GADAFRVLAEAQVLKITHDGRRASGVVCRLSDGRTIEVRAKTIVVAAGALASSVILRRSGIGGDRVGHGLAFNIGSPIVADMPHLVRSTEGLQITHALKFPDKPVALESWFMPLLGMSLLMPGWFGDHQRNMRRYGHLAAIGVVVGSQGNATVKPSRLSRRAVDLDYVPTDRDRTLLLDGIRAATEIFLAAGATRVMAPTFTYTEARHPDEIDAFVASVRDDDLLINTAHPQGGNAISTNPDRGVVGNDLRVHGTDNVFVCDASVFPSSITLNPQLTVMALADYAVDPVAAS
ncbi:MAG: hypothetical protein QOF76_3585, partial [Solirubrobacteraceae bacterium]|nr:hypothetical protein [Solirubrobacteraceae bacterium]